MTKYRVKIERIVEVSINDRKARLEELRATGGFYNTSLSAIPTTEVVEALSFECDDRQFEAIRSAALESMKGGAS